MRKLEEGMILLQETCDSIEISLNGESRDIGYHIEHWLIQEITKNGYILYNLDKGRTWKVDKDKMEMYLWENKKMNIKPLLKLSEERA